MDSATTRAAPFSLALLVCAPSVASAAPARSPVERSIIRWQRSCRLHPARGGLCIVRSRVSWRHCGAGKYAERAKSRRPSSRRALSALARAAGATSPGRGYPTATAAFVVAEAMHEQFLRSGAAPPRVDFSTPHPNRAFRKYTQKIVRAFGVARDAYGRVLALGPDATLAALTRARQALLVLHYARLLVTFPMARPPRPKTPTARADPAAFVKAFEKMFCAKLLSNARALLTKATARLATCRSKAPDPTRRALCTFGRASNDGAKLR